MMNCLLLACLVLTEVVTGFQPANKTALQTAVDAYVANSTQAESDYGGPPGTWDTSNITDMSNLFDNKKTFTSDLSSLDVSRTTTLAYTFRRATVFTSQLFKSDVKTRVE